MTEQTVVTKTKPINKQDDQIEPINKQDDQIEPINKQDDNNNHKS